MVVLGSLNEIEQRMIMERYIKTGIIEGDVILPDILVASYRCVVCNSMKYVRIHRLDIRNITQTIKCNCNRSSIMRLRHIGDENIITLIPTEAKVNKVFTLDDFF